MDTVIYNDFNQVLLPEYLQGIADEMVQAGNILAFVDNADGTYTVSADSVFGLVNFSNIVISGTINFDGVYSIFDLSTKTFKINREIGFTTEIGIWTQPVNFKYGTYISIESELNSDTNNLEKRINLMCLIETNRVEIDFTRNVPIWLRANVLMAFMTPNDSSWKTRQNHEDFAIKPMFNLFYLFTDFADIESGAVISQAKYGVEKTFQGHKEALLPKTSGIEVLNLDIEIKKESNCLT